MAEGEPDVVQHHVRLVAVASGGPPVGRHSSRSDDFVVGMLHEDREQLQRIALCQRGSALLFLHLDEPGHDQPSPSTISGSAGLRSIAGLNSCVRGPVTLLPGRPSSRCR